MNRQGEMIGQIPITSTELSADLFPVLGEGLWGTVLDLKDGTVLKLARQKCAGIGDGAEKIAREFQVLSSLDGSTRASFVTAKPLGWGNRRMLKGGDDRTQWLHTTKVLGGARKIADLTQLSNEDISKLVMSTVDALIVLHDRLSSIRCRVPTGVENLDSIENSVSRDPDASRYIESIKKVFASLEKREEIIIHGDFNISNILIEGATVRSIVDFAEVRWGSYEEDLAALISELPSFKEHILERFQGETGLPIDELRMSLALATKSFFSLVIRTNLGDLKEAAISRRTLENQLSELR